MQRRRMLAGLTAGLALSPLARPALATNRAGTVCTVASDPVFRDGFEPAGLVPDVADYYLPQELCFIGWDHPAFAHVGIDIDYKLTGYDWFNRQLHWQVVSGPAGMFIDADGTLHWSPKTEGEYCVIVHMHAGARVIERQFSIVVDNQRCVFVDGLAASGGDGSLAAPFATLLDALATVSVGSGKLVYVRGGLDYEINGVSWYGQTPGHPFRRVAQGTWNQNDPLILRAYPGESVRYTFNEGSGFVVGSGVVVLGFELVGGSGVVGENACLVLGSGSVAKRNIARDYACSYQNNCTGIRFRGGCLLDGNIASDNYDRANLLHHNSSNYLFFGTSGTPGNPDSFVIDCISGGYSVQGYKIKHAGDQGRLHLHRCVGYGTRNPYAGASNRSSVRHSLMYSARPASTNGGYVLGLTATDPSTGGQVHLNEGMLIEHNLLAGDHPESEGMAQATYAFADGHEHPACYRHNRIQMAANSSPGHGYITAPWQPLPPQWSAVFEYNRFRSNFAGNLLRMGQGTTLPADHLNLHYGAGNSHDGTAQVEHFQAAGHEWTCDPAHQRLLRDGVVIDGLI